MSIAELQLTPSVKLPPVEQRLLDKLSDGEKHSVAELIPLIDELASKTDLANHVSKLRSNIFHSGYLIAAHTAGKRGLEAYQLVRRLRISLD